MPTRIIRPRPESGSASRNPYDGPEKFACLRQLIIGKDYGRVAGDTEESELRGMCGAGFPTFD